MLNTSDQDGQAGHPTIYQIRVKSHLGRQWTDRFEELSITLEADGTTLLTGPVVDQAALYGILRKVRDLGLVLLAVNLVGAGPQDASDN
ncbi:hypothetical protein [Promineifilum sp.]|uniref:hypothetical protein n=1 Tax=Promineifilum sp. TaxID=2664178 RepID=UPI0035B49C2F